LTADGKNKIAFIIESFIGEEIQRKQTRNFLYLRRFQYSSIPVTPSLGYLKKLASFDYDFF
jgi:hypothetical protein